MTLSTITTTHTTITFHETGCHVDGVTPRWVVLDGDGDVYNARFTFASREEAEERARGLCAYGAPNTVELRAVEFTANKWGRVAFRPDPDGPWSDD